MYVPNQDARVAGAPDKLSDVACYQTLQVDHLIGNHCINASWVFGPLLLDLVFDMLGGAVDVDCA